MATRAGQGSAVAPQRILIAVEGTRGDVHPMVELGLAFMRAGHDVRMCAPPDFRDVVERAGFDYVPYGVSIRAFLTESADALKGSGLGLLKAVSRFSRDSIEHQFDTFPAAAADRDFVFAAGTIIAAASAAELHDIPFRFVAYTPALLPSVQHSPALFSVQSARPWVNRVLWKLCIASANALLRRRVNRRRRKLGLAGVRDVFMHVFSECPIVAVDRPLAPMPPDCPVAYQQIRGLHRTGGETLPSKLETFLASGPPPVFIGFGSMTDPDPEATTQVVLAAIERVGCRALISEGWAGLGQSPLPEGVMSIGAVSHADLFRRVAAVVHHGGSGTTQTAARAGVPQIIVPHVLDQYYFARRVCELGIGPPAIPSAQLSTEKLAERLEATLDNEFLSERAEALALRLMSAGHVDPDVSLLLDPDRSAR